MEKLTDKEVDIMMAIWNATIIPVSTGEILRQIKLRVSNKTSLQVLQVVLRRMCEKGVIVCEKSRHMNFYRPLISEDEYVTFAADNFLFWHFRGSLKRLILFELRHRNISIEELSKMLE